VAPVGERDLRPVDRAQAERLGGLRELHRSADRVVIGERERRVVPFERGRHQFLRLRGAVQEGEGRVAVELDVGHEHMFA
jgi:hypothetical protein